MNTLRLEIADKIFVVYPLRSSRVVAVARIVSNGTSVWAVNADGRIYHNNLQGIRKRIHSWESAGPLQLKAEDIDALSWLGLIGSAATHALREEMLFQRDYERQKSSLTYDAECLEKAGVRLPSRWQKMIHESAEATAAKLQKKRRTEALAAKRKRSCQ